MLSNKKASFRISMLLSLLPLLREAIGDKESKVLKGVLHKADIHLKDASGYIYGSEEFVEGFWISTEEIVDCGYLHKHKVGFIKTSCGSIYLIADVNYNPLEHESTHSSYSAIISKKLSLLDSPQSAVKQSLAA